MCSALGRSFVVLTMSGAWQEVKQSFLSVCVLPKDAGSHQVVLGSLALGMRVIAESTGVIGEL